MFIVSFSWLNRTGATDVTLTRHPWVEFEEDWEQYEDYHREEDTDEDGETGDGVDPDPTSANEGTAAEGWDGDDAANRPILRAWLGVSSGTPPMDSMDP